MADKNRADNCGNNVKPEWIPSAYSVNNKHVVITIKEDCFKPTLYKREHMFAREGFKRKNR